MCMCVFGVDKSVSGCSLVCFLRQSTASIEYAHRANRTPILFVMSLSHSCITSTQETEKIWILSLYSKKKMMMNKNKMMKKKMDKKKETKNSIATTKTMEARDVCLDNIVRVDVRGRDRKRKSAIVLYGIQISMLRPINGTSLSLSLSSPYAPTCRYDGPLFVRIFFFFLFFSFLFLFLFFSFSPSLPPFRTSFFSSLWTCNGFGVFVNGI